MKKQRKLNKVRLRRQKRVRRAILGVSSGPRLSIFRSNVHIYAQLIDDFNRKTLASASSKEIKGKANKTEKAKKVGQLVAERGIKAGIKSAVFDRGKYRYHGRVKALADSVRESGLKI